MHLLLGQRRVAALGRHHPAVGAVVALDGVLEQGVLALGDACIPVRLGQGGRAAGTGGVAGAAERGVDVHLILPGKPDKWFAYALAKTHYLPLLSSGVKISEWTPGFTHAKVMIMDGQEAVVGTINLDYRSLYHHFENAVWMRGVDCLPRIEADFQDTLAQCRTVEPTRQSVWQGKKLLHLVGIVLKFIAPLI